MGQVNRYIHKARLTTLASDSLATRTNGYVCYIKEGTEMWLKEETKMINDQSNEESKTEKIINAFTACGVNVKDKNDGSFIPFIDAVKQLSVKWEELEGTNEQKELLDCFSK